MAQPEFARTRLEVLGLSHLPTWFELVRSSVPLDNPRADFIPSHIEYENGLVYRPADAERVVVCLNNPGRVLVEGVGASGKSVLAWLLALEACREGRPSYYLDLARINDDDTAIDNGLEEDLLRFSHPSVLFILDNIHRNERKAEKVIAAWDGMGASQRPQLLLLARKLKTGRGSAFAKVEIPIITLRARQAELQGVYRRLIWRRTGRSAFAEPPPNVLNEWVATFGGDPLSENTTTDLIAFSAAVLKRLPDLLRERWTLREEDAVDEIREAYLKKLNEGEVRNITRLAVLAEVELPLAESALFDPRAAFDVTCRQLGLVFRDETTGRESHVSYRFAHPALGRLFLAASFDQIDIEREQLVVAIAYPDIGFALSHLLVGRGLRSRARAVLARMSLLEAKRLFSVSHLGTLHGALHLMEGLGLNTDLIEIVRTASDSVGRSYLVDLTLRTQLQHIQAFLAYTEKKTELRPLFEGLCAAVEKPEYLPLLIERAISSPLVDIQRFLAYAQYKHELEVVFDALCDALGKDENLATLVNSAVHGQTHVLHSFLVLASESMVLRSAFHALSRELVKPKNLDPLIESALRTSPHLVKGFLAYAERRIELTVIFDAICDAFTKDQNLQSVVNGAVRTRLESLPSLLTYAENTPKLSAFFDAVYDKLRMEVNWSVLVARLTASRLDHLIPILTSIDTARGLWRAAILAIDLAEWDRAHVRVDVPTMVAFKPFQRLVAANGRPELAVAPALAMIRTTEPSVWHAQNIGLGCVFDVLEVAASVATCEEIRCFLDMIGTKRWIEEQFAQYANAETLADGLLKLAGKLPPGLMQRLTPPCLVDRVIKELSILPPGEFDAWAAPLALLGATVLLDLPTRPLEVSWPDPTDSRAIIELLVPSPESTTMSPLQIGLWLGIREMVNSRDDVVSVRPEYGEHILTRWQAIDRSEGASFSKSHIDIQMITWLEKCRAAGWRLVKENNPEYHQQ